VALTNYARLTNEQLTVWSRDTWKQARNVAFLTRYLGSGPNACFQQINELKKDQKGARAVITLIPDLEGDGVAGDRTLKGNEEASKSYDQVIRIDQLRNANKHEGRMADQKSVVRFREESRDILAYWLADRMDQIAFLTLAGIAYSQKNNGATRVGSDLPFLEYAADVTPPSSRRFARWNAGSAAIEVGVGSSAVTAADTPSWKMLVNTKAFMKDQYIRPLRGENGEEAYHVFLPPLAMAKLKLDTDYLEALRHAQPRGNKNPLFVGSVPLIDGLYTHEYRHVPNTGGAAPGSKYGAGGTVEGAQIIFCGAQALGFADIGNPEWVEEGDDYENQQGIAVGKICGLLKPQFITQYAGGTLQDHGVFSTYVAT